MGDELVYAWRDPVTDEPMVDSHRGQSAAGWWDLVWPHSLGG